MTPPNPPAIARALALASSGDVAAALDALASALADPSARSLALGHRAWILRSLGRYEEALRDYDALLADDPSNLPAAAFAAETRLLAGEIDAALAQAIALLQRDPANSLAAEVVARAQRALGVAPSSPQPPAPLGAARSPNPVIELLESQSASFPTSVQPAVGRIIYWLVRSLQPALAIETGTFIGYSALCIAQAMEENGAGHLHAFDLFTDRPGAVSPVIGPCDDSLAAARAHLERAGLAARVTFHKGDSSESIRAELGRSGARVDFAFIDGDHTVRGCFKDWGAVDALMAEGGVALLHDSTPGEKNGWLGPRLLLEELQSRWAGSYSWINLPTRDGYGLALVQKRAAAPAAWRPSVGALAFQWLSYRLRGK